MADIIKPETKAEPCPFCGGTVVEVFTDEDSALIVDCKGCGAFLYTQIDAESYDEAAQDQNGVTLEERQQAIEVWNKRHLPPLSSWEEGKQELALAALEWERLRRGMPGATPASIKLSEKVFWEKARQLQGIKVAMLQKHIDDARAASPDGKTQWDRVEDFRIAHGHLPGDTEAEVVCVKCKRGSNP